MNLASTRIHPPRLAKLPDLPLALPAMRNRVATVKTAAGVAVIGTEVAVVVETQIEVARQHGIATAAVTVKSVPGRLAKKPHPPVKLPPVAVAMMPTGTNWTSGCGMTPSLSLRIRQLPSRNLPLMMMISGARLQAVRQQPKMTRKQAPLVDADVDADAAAAVEIDDGLKIRPALDLSHPSATTPAPPMLMTT